MDRLSSLAVIGALVLFVFLLASPQALPGDTLAAAAALTTLLAVLFQNEWRQARARLGEVRFVRIAAALIGASLGGVVGLALVLPAAQMPAAVPYAVAVLMVAVAAGAVIGTGFFEEWRVLFGASSRGLASPQDAYLVDTSALIDGRIADLIERGMLVGNFYVPKFVLVELQRVADSEKARTRGRRGLAVMTRLRASDQLIVKDLDKPELVGADAKLKAIAKEIGITLITNDANLKMLCESEDISVLSMHEVANALRPAVFPGDVFEVKVTRPGKRPDQGTGFLPDGDMVVVEDGRRYLGQTMRVQVRKVLQRTPEEGGGRTVFVQPMPGA